MDLARRLGRDDRHAVRHLGARVQDFVDGDGQEVHLADDLAGTAYVADVCLLPPRGCVS